MTERRALHAAMFGTSFALILFELALTRVFGVVLFASFAHLALALAMLGIAAGALAQHLWPALLPDRGLERRAGWLCLYLAGAAVLATLAAVRFPVTVQFAEPPVTYGERSSVYGDLVDPFWFPALLPFLAAPFALGGLIFAGAFQRRRAWIGSLYGADLLGGAAGAVAFVPLLYRVSAPDAAFAVALAAVLPAGALFAAARDRMGLSAAAALGLGAAAALGTAATGHEVLRVRYAAGYSEQNVTWVRWTPLTRLAIHEDARGAYMLLDNTSASEIVTTPRRVAARAREANRAAVYQLHRPPARVAILAASAGPEVAVARHYGFEDIDAIDIAAEIADAVATRFADAPVNPFRGPGVRRIRLDGRAAILHADHRYDIIQMVHANLHSSAGLLAAAWSPALLETRQAFATYFDHLTPDGTLSFARGVRTHEVGRAVVAALRDRGVADPRRHLALIRGDSSVLLAKARPFTRRERNRLRAWLRTLPRQHLAFDPLAPDPEVWRTLSRGPVLTDDHPYFDRPATVLDGMARGLTTLALRGAQLPASLVLYRTLALQALAVLAAGAVLFALPLAVRGRRAIRRGDLPFLLFVCGLGYGYLAVETVLIHALVLFVGHPVYAVTAVILAMLLSSGLGAMTVARIPARHLRPALHAALGATLALGALHAWVVPAALTRAALGAPLAARAGLTLAVLAPLGFAMGMPFPLGLRLLPADREPLVPWAWALNGWTSVAAALGTVLLARGWGYSAAFAVALAAYAGALAVSGRVGVEPASPR